MPNMENDADLALHDRQARAIMEAVAELMPRFGPQGFTPEAVFEGAVKGAAVVLLRAGAAPKDVARILEEMGGSLVDIIERPKLKLVHNAGDGN